MALIQCQECGKEISDKAASCPGCGAPVSQPKAKRGSREPYSEQEVAMMLSKRKRTSHVLHLLLSILTAGVWIIVWLIVAISNSSENSKIESKIKKGKKVK